MKQTITTIDDKVLEVDKFMGGGYDGKYLAKVGNDVYYRHYLNKKNNFTDAYALLKKDYFEDKNAKTK